MSKFKGTPGPWSLPHFADADSKCDCGWILSETCFGSVATINVDNGKRIGEGGNDCPPLEEAIANARLIAAAPELLELAEVLGKFDWKSIWSTGAADPVFDMICTAKALIARIEGETQSKSTHERRTEPSLGLSGRGARMIQNVPVRATDEGT